VRRHLIVGNWKMHGGLDANRRLLQGVLAGVDRGSAGVEVAVCVPFPYLAQVGSLLSGSALAWGAQDVSEHAEGAYTGEVSATMLRDFACAYAIVGHSERRVLHRESDEQVAGKFAALIGCGIRPILCLGETLAQRDAGETLAVVGRQLRSVVGRVGLSSFADAVIAYEPVWAIGTGRTATPVQAQEVHAAIRDALGGGEVAAGVRILYGGSVKPQNASELFAMPDIDGALVGGASLVIDDFLAICQLAGR